jgi:hypothetical protein
LVIFKSVPVNPTSSQGKLDVIQQHHLLGLHGLIKKSGPRHKVWLMAGDHHNKSSFQWSAISRQFCPKDRIMEKTREKI